MYTVLVFLALIFTGLFIAFCILQRKNNSREPKPGPAELTPTKQTTSTSSNSDSMDNFAVYNLPITDQLLHVHSNGSKVKVSIQSAAGGYSKDFEYKTSYRHTCTQMATVSSQEDDNKVT